jgi:hypothetical protein
LDLVAVVKTDRQVDQAEEVLEGQETPEDTLHQKETMVEFLIDHTTQAAEVAAVVELVNLED